MNPSLRLAAVYTDDRALADQALWDLQHGECDVEYRTSVKTVKCDGC